MTKNENRTISFLQAIPLAAIPIFLAASAGYMSIMIAPIYAGLFDYDYDPSYQYLFNGIGLVEGYVPRHIDHPGTPLQILSGLVSYLSWLIERFTGQTTFDFSAAVVADPEHYISIISALLLTMNVAAIFYLGVRIKNATQNATMAMVAQVGFATLNMITPRLSYLSPEALVIFSGVMAAAFLSDILLFSPSRNNMSARSAIAVGFFLALGVTSKITFLPLILLSVILPTAKARLICFSAIAIFGILFVLPIITELPAVTRWFSSIATHKGQYGEGESGFIDFAELPNRLWLLCREIGFIFVAGTASILAILICVFRTESENVRGMRRREIWVSVILLTTITAQLAMVLKHFGLHYILPSFAISSTLLVRTLRLLELQISRRFAGAVTNLAVAALTVVVVQQTYTNFRNLSSAGHERNSRLASMQQVLDANSDALVLSAYRAHNQNYAIQFALGWVNGAFARRLMKDDFQKFSYNRWNHLVMQVGVGMFKLDTLNELIGKGLKVLLILPEDVQNPALEGDVLLQIPGKERILRLTRVWPSNPRPIMQ